MRKPANKVIKEAFNAAVGNVSATAQILGVTRQSVHNWLKKSKELRDAREEAEEAILDMAESKLNKAIKDGDLTAIIFTLKTKGKARGYVERQEINFNKDDVVKVGYDNGD